jgi:hypothetical protein
MGKRKNNYLVSFVTLAVIILAVVFVFWFKEYKAEKVGLLQYVPEEAQAFMEFNLANQTFNNYLEKDEGFSLELEKFLISKGLPTGIWKSDIPIDRLAFFILPGEEKKEGAVVWLIHGEGDIGQLEAFSLQGYYYTVLDEKTAAISFSREAISKIKNQQNFKLSKLIFLGESFLPYGAETNAVDGCLKKDFWAGFFSEFMADNKFLENNTLFKSNGNVCFKFNINERGNLVLLIDVPLGEKPSLTTEINNDFLLLDRTIEIGGFQLDLIIENIKKKFAEDSQTTWDDLEKYLKEKYKIKPEALYTFFKQPGVLVLKPNKQNSDWLKTIRDQDYVYAFMMENNFRKEEIDNLEKLIKNYFAFRYPEKRVKILPDGSRGLELVANESKFNFSKRDEKMVVMRVVKSEELEFGYAIFQNKFMIADNLKLLQEVIDTLSKKEESKEENETEMIINNGFFREGFLKDKKLLFKSDFLGEHWLVNVEID